MKYRSWEEIWQSHNALTSLQGDQLLLIKADVLASQIHVEKRGTAMLVTDSWKTKSNWLCGCLSSTSVNYRLMYLHWLLISLLTMLGFPNLFIVASGLGLASARDQGSVKNHGADTCPEDHALSPFTFQTWLIKAFLSNSTRQHRSRVVSPASAQCWPASQMEHKSQITNPAASVCVGTHRRSSGFDSRAQACFQKKSEGTCTREH